MDIIGLLTALGLSTAAGLNAWFPLLATGLIARYTGVLHLTGEWAQLTQTPVLLGLGAVSVMDFIGDKIAGVDHILHLVGTVVAPATAVLSALASTGSLDVSPTLVTIVALVAAETSHGTRLAIRPFVTAGTAGTGNPVVSLVEDVISAVLAVAAILAPVVAGLLILVLAWIAWRIIRRIRRRVRQRGDRAPPPPALA